MVGIWGDIRLDFRAITILFNCHPGAVEFTAEEGERPHLGGVQRKVREGGHGDLEGVPDEVDGGPVQHAQSSEHS